jgi:hypothetical protein
MTTESETPKAPRVRKPKTEAPVAPQPKATAAKALPRVLKSTVEAPTKRVWAIADAMPGAKRSVVVAACVAEGIATGTARTQYQKWSRAQKG